MSQCASNHHQAASALRRQSSFRTSCSRRTNTLLKERSPQTERTRRHHRHRHRWKEKSTTLVTTQALVPGPDDRASKEHQDLNTSWENRGPIVRSVFDTTLRDGEQSPATLTSTEKVQIATNLAKLGVDIIEAGFPIASPDDLEGEEIMRDSGNKVSTTGTCVICGLSRANEKDIACAWKG